ncbi:MAG TPA: HEAT repeat domain-containing protein, partial [Planctomycetota bacterium]|nr:HEAT repeat domain-containing protein [Planctomycetota bacterium]
LILMALVLLSAAYGAEPTKKTPDELIELLKSQDANIRRDAVWKLGQFGGGRNAAALEEQKRIVAAITPLIKDPENSVRYQAFTALDSFREVTIDAVPALLESTIAAEARDQSCIASVLSRIGAPALPKLVAALEHEKVPVRKCAASALRQMAIPERSAAIPALVKLISREQDAVTLAKAMGALESTSEAAPEALEPLTKLLDHPELEIRGLACLLLGQLCGEQARQQVPKILKVLREADVDGPGSISMRWSGAAIALIGVDEQQAKEAVPLLIMRLCDKRYLGDGDSVFSHALARIGPVVVTEVAKILNHENVRARSIALLTLGRLGDAARDCVPAIKAAQSNRDLKTIAIFALTACGPDDPEVAAKIQDLLKAPKPNNDESTLLYALAFSNKGRGLLKDGLLTKKQATCVAPLWAGIAHPENRAILVEALNHPDAAVRTIALSGMEISAREHFIAIPILREMAAKLPQESVERKALDKKRFSLANSR